MLHVSRNLVLALTLTLAVALAGCGGGDAKTASTATTQATATVPPATIASSLNAAQYAALNAGAGAVVKDLAAIGEATTACTSGSAAKDDAAACISGRLDKATTELGDLADQVRTASADISGTCQTDLRTFATDIDALATSFKTASKSLQAGDGAGATTALKALPLDAVTASGNAAQTSCKPAS